MIKVCLVGTGGISGAHIPAWDSMTDVKLTALCDIRSECLAPYPDKHHYSDFDTMLEEEKPDILDICLPTYLHADYAVKAMERGIHVICEKPASLKEEEIERVYSAARRMNVKFMIAQVLRFWPEYELIREVYQTKKYGRLLSGHMSRLGSSPKWSWNNWMMDKEKSGLVPFDLHIHDLDFIVYAFGIPQNVRKHRASLPDQDYLNAVYEFPDFFICAESSWYAAPYPFSAGFRFQFEEALITYEAGICKIYQNDGQVLDLTADAEGDTGSINLPKSNAYANEIRYFTDCVMTDQFPDKVKQKELQAVVKILSTF